jgi:4-carboxymuconolactone decarboxylase
MSALDAGTEALVALSAALAAGSGDGVADALRAAARVSDPVAVEEALLQSHLFLGYPAALNGLARWRELSGLAAPAPADDRQRWAERGEEVCRVVYGGQYEGLRANVRRLHPDVERWMVEDGYGRVLGRPGLDLPVRELCISAILAVQDAPRQLYSHLRGALNAGAGRAQVSRALELAAAVSAPAARERAAETWTEVRRRAAGAG